MSTEISVKGLVVKEEDIRESDKIITLLTGEMGRITVSCIGVRNLKSKRFPAVQMFTYSDITLTQRAGKYYLKEAEIIESFFGVRSDIDRISLAYYIAEVASVVSVENQDEGEILSLVLNSLFVLSEGKKDLMIIKSVFEMRLAAVLGFSPMTDFCSLCGKRAESCYLDILGGLVRCPECVFGDNKTEESDGKLVFLEKDVLLAITYILKAPAKRIFAFEENAVNKRELMLVCEEFFLAHIERGFASLDFCKKLLLT